MKSNILQVNKVNAKLRRPNGSEDSCACWQVELEYAGKRIVILKKTCRGGVGNIHFEIIGIYGSSLVIVEHDLTDLSKPTVWLYEAYPIQEGSIIKYQPTMEWHGIERFVRCRYPSREWVEWNKGWQKIVRAIRFGFILNDPFLDDVVVDYIAEAKAKMTEEERIRNTVTERLLEAKLRSDALREIEEQQKRLTE